MTDKKIPTGGQPVGGTAGHFAELDTPIVAQSPNGDNKQITKARAAIGAILDGHSPNGVTPGDLGQYGEVYGEMLRAHGQGGTEAARRVYVAYAEQSVEITALRAADPEPAKRFWTTGELLRAQFPDPKWAVPGLLPVGLCILAGRPKLGKSWLSLQAAVAVGSGGKFLDRDIEKGKALYLALEDSPRRLKERLAKQQATADTLTDYRFEWPLLQREQGIAGLTHEIDHNGYTLIVIDTLARAVGGADQMDQGEMNVICGTLQRIAQDRQITIVLVHHHRKKGITAGDVIDDVMGATSIAGVADAVMGLYKERGKKDAELKVTGRDVDEQELAVRFDSLTGCWQLVGDAQGVRMESVQADILNAVVEHGGRATARQIAGFLGKRANNISRELQELVTKGALVRGAKKGRTVPYSLPGNEESEPTEDSEIVDTVDTDDDENTDPRNPFADV